MSHYLHGPIGQIAGVASDREPLGFEPGAVAEVNALDLAGHSKTAHHLVQELTVSAWAANA